MVLVSDVEGGRFSEAAMWTALTEVAGALRFDVDGARLLRLTNNAVFALPDHGVVVRITRSHTLHDRIVRQVALARWFTQVDAPTIRLADVAGQPIEVSGMLATVWDYVPPAAPATVADLGRALREFHTLGAPDVALPAWNPIADVRARLFDADGLSEVDHRFLAEQCDELEPRLGELVARHPAGLIHGDAHVGNLLRDPLGRVLWCDFDATCLGPAMVDLAAVPVGEERFGRPGAHRELVHAYGLDVTRSADWPLLRAARELKMVAAAVPLLASDPRVAREFAVRLGSLRTGDRTTRWTPYAEITRTPPTTPPNDPPT